MSYTSEWKPTLSVFHCCAFCDSNQIEYREWESSDGAYDDIHYKCLTCKKEWWSESADS